MCIHDHEGSDGSRPALHLSLQLPTSASVVHNSEANEQLAKASKTGACQPAVISNDDIGVDILHRDRIEMNGLA